MGSSMAETSQRQDLGLMMGQTSKPQDRTTLVASYVQDHIRWLICSQWNWGGRHQDPYIQNPTKTAGGFCGIFIRTAERVRVPSANCTIFARPVNSWLDTRLRFIITVLHPVSLKHRTLVFPTRPHFHGSFPSLKLWTTKQALGCQFLNRAPVLYTIRM